MMSGLVESIYLHVGQTGGEPMVPVDSARAVLAAGLEGDRFWQGPGSSAKKKGSDREVTLIEAETIEGLRERGVLVRSGAALGRPGALRVTIGSDEENRRFLAAMSELV